MLPIFPRDVAFDAFCRFLYIFIIRPEIGNSLCMRYCIAIGRKQSPSRSLSCILATPFEYFIYNAAVYFFIFKHKRDIELGKISFEPSGEIAPNKIRKGIGIAGNEKRVMQHPSWRKVAIHSKTHMQIETFPEKAPNPDPLKRYATRHIAIAISVFPKTKLQGGFSRDFDIVNKKLH